MQSRTGTRVREPIFTHIERSRHQRGHRRLLLVAVIGIWILFEELALPFILENLSGIVIMVVGIVLVAMAMRS